MRLSRSVGALPLLLLLGALPFLAAVVWCVSLVLGSAGAVAADREGLEAAGATVRGVAAVTTPRATLTTPDPPLLAPLVEDATLPPLAERIPRNPRVIDGPDTPADPVANPYGGTWLRLATADADVGVIAHRLSMSTPLRWTADGTGVVPHVAESVVASENDTAFTVTLRDGHRWSDGEPFTTADVMFWWEHDVLDPAVGGGQAPEWLRHAGEAATFEAISPTVLVIRFTTPNGLFPQRLASINAWEMLASPAHYLRKVHPTLGDPQEIAKRSRALGQPSPTALYRDLKLWNNPEIPRLWPWICRDRRDSAPFVFVRNPYYFCVDDAGRQLPYIDRVQFDVQGQQLLALAASNGQASMQARGLGFDKYTDLMSRRDAGGYDVLRWAATGAAWVLHPNQNRKVDPADPVTADKAALLGDARFREALSLAIDRERIVRAEYLGLVEPAAEVVVPGSDWYPPREHAAPLHDPARAEALLDALGLERPTPGAMRRFADGRPMTFFIDFSPFTGPGPVDFVVDDWARVGVRAIPRARARALYMLGRDAGTSDFLVWTGESDRQPLLSPRHFVPYGSESFWAVGWGRWFEEGGLFGNPAAQRRGTAPPPGSPAREAMETYQRALEAPNEATRRTLFAELRELARANFWTIQIATPPPQPVVVDRDLRNVPAFAVDGNLFGSPGHTNIEAYFFASRENSPGAVAAARSSLRRGETAAGAPRRLAGESADRGGIGLFSWTVRGSGVLLLVGLGWAAVRRPFIGKRLLIMVPTLAVLSIAVYTVVQLPPGDYLTTQLIQLEATGAPNADQEIRELRELYHFDESMVSRYFRWVGLHWFTSLDPADAGLLQGDLGRSMQTGRPVNDVVGDRLLLTVAIALGTIVLTWALAIPVGVYSAVRQYTPGDYVVTLVSFLGMCVPPFLLALVLMAVAGVSGLFSPEYAATPEWSWGKVVDLAGHVWIPIVVLGLGGTGGMIRVMRANMLDELRKPYVTTARAKGLSEARTVLKYPLRIALNPFISRVGSLFPQLISGGAIVAIVLSLPTVGPLLLTSLFNEDTELSASLLMLLSLLGIVGTLVSDLLLLALDPRIRFEGGTR